MVILGGSDAIATVRDLLRKASWARLAVAYWGDGATERLGLAEVAKRADVQIALDLMSGACNPDEVRRLLKVVGRENVVAVRRLHAKVWVTDTGALIGSSNASANGFGHEGDDPEVAGLIEANVAFSPLPTGASCVWRKWFEHEVWDKGRAITASMLLEAERLWRAKRARRDAGGAASAPKRAPRLDKLCADPAFFRDKPLSIWIYRHGKLSKPAMEGLKAEQKQRHSPELDCYEGRKSKVGELILDFDTSGRGIRFDGLWKAADERPYVRLDGTSISLVYRASHFDGLFVRGDTRARKRAIAATLKASRHPEIFKTAEHFAGLLAKVEER